eukprot:XP_001709440.1 VSP [Giardia lamblia ATCC 50803]
MLYLAGLAFAYLALADPKSCTNSQNCASGNNCLDVNINGQQKEVCTKCEATHVPVEGACQAKDGQDKCTPQDAPDGTCKACQGSTYLYSGGCYTACPQGTPNSETNTCDGVPAPDCNLPNCEVCSDDKQTCTKCQGNYFLTPEKNACLASCPAGSYAVGQTCGPCDPSCAECSGAGASKCTACPAGKMLRYADESNPTDGTCVEQCVEGPECETCGLTIGGTKYCSKCKGSNVPLNGVCTSNAARTRFCTTAADGACTACAAGYFIQEGGCYQTTRLPGKSICTTDSGGKCQTCANGQNPNSGTGVCPLCDSTCKTCAAGQTQQCQTCFSGYYKSGTKCVKCDASDSQITGVTNCVSCAPPSGDSGSVTCYVKMDGTDNGGSVNKSGLSTGAIAGISVAVIVVVGGLVGFLCWWFLCRGKA